MSKQMISYSVKVEELSEEPYCNILCYPNPSESEISSRIEELRSLGVEVILFEGRASIGGLRILGKGCVSVVVKSQIGNSIYALKIRRMDADRADMKREAELLRRANSVDIGPEFYKASTNFLLMEFVDGAGLLEFMKTLAGKGMVMRLKNLLKDLLVQCYKLDEMGLDHGELSDMVKHVLVTDRVMIIDFESASLNRRPRNVTSAVQYLLVGGPFANKTRRILRIPSAEYVIQYARSYKADPSTQSFKNLLSALKLEAKRDR